MGIGRHQSGSSTRIWGQTPFEAHGSKGGDWIDLRTYVQRSDIGKQLLIVSHRAKKFFLLCGESEEEECPHTTTKKKRAQLPPSPPHQPQHASLLKAACLGDSFFFFFRLMITNLVSPKNSKRVEMHRVPKPSTTFEDIKYIPFLPSLTSVFWVHQSPKTLV